MIAAAHLVNTAVDIRGEGQSLSTAPRLAGCGSLVSCHPPDNRQAKAPQCSGGAFA